MADEGALGAHVKSDSLPDLSEVGEPQVKRRRLSSASTDTEIGQNADPLSEIGSDGKQSQKPSDLILGEGVAEKDLVPSSSNTAKEIETQDEQDTMEGQHVLPSDSQEETEIEEEVALVKPLKQTTKKKKKQKKSIHRKDIRKIMTVDQLDEETLAAQKEEAERLQRIAEKQQNLKQAQAASAPMIPVSFVDDNEMTLSLSDLYDDLEIPSVTLEAETKQVTDRVEKEEKQVSEIQVEHEVYTLSSDDDEQTIEGNKPCSTEEGPSKLNYDFSRTSGGVVYAGNSTKVITLDDEEPKSMTLKPESEVQVHDDSDDDDCIVISPPPTEHEEDKDEEANNRPDEFGRALVNIGHPEGEPDIFLPPRIADAMKPHQIGGVRFLYDNLVESLERFEHSSGFGCIIAHSMGLGKTIQAAAFCEIFIRCTSARTVLVIVPINTIQNWSHEFNHWLPTEVNSSTFNGGKRKVPQGMKKITDFTTAIKEDQPEENLSNNSDLNEDGSLSQEESKSKRLNLFVLNETIKTLEYREKIISEWGREGGVLLIGYEMYRMLALRKLKKSVKKKGTFAQSKDVTTDEQDDLLDKIHKSLVRPGPDLVICDEGHRIKNSGASISQALKSIRTRRRVVLTGYPLQNNLMEYWCMVDFIRPNYLGTKAEFSNMFERPISNGQCADSTPQDKRLMQFRSHVLHSLLQGFVQRRSHAVLKRALPPKQEFVFLVKMSPIQYKLYKEYINYIQLQVDLGQSTPNPIKAFAVCSKLWNHPDALYRVMKKKQSVLVDDLEIEDLTAEVNKLKRTTKSSKASATTDDQDNASPSNSNSDNIFNGRECVFTGAGAGFGLGDNSRKDKESNSKQVPDSLISLEWASSCFEDYTPGVLENGTKFQLLFIIIEETLAVGDKLLVFSQSLLTLDLMETFLHAKYEWKKGKHYFRLDGSTQGLEREKLINEFNGQHSANVFLVSTRAGSLGVNLVGANRVVVFDASWNPCHDCQAVCRIYRYGQKKPCQIYRFVTDYTLEKQIYDRQIHKGGMANRVVDEMNPDSHFNSKELLSTLLLEIRDLGRSQATTTEYEVDNYSDTAIKSLLTKCGDKITRKPFEHESLLIDRKEKKLSAAERRLAVRNYEIEKKAAANYTNGVGRGPNHTSGGGIVYPGRSSDTNSWNSSSFASSSGYSHYGSYSRDSFSKPVASIRPYQREIYDQGSVSMVPNTKPAGSSMNWPAVIEDLRRRGLLTTQVIKLRKNYVMPNPSGGRDVYLRPGDKLELIRARKCSYIRLMNGQFMAMRRGSRGYTFLDTIPFSQQLNGEQLGIFLSSFLREIPPEYAGRSLYPSSSLTFNNSSDVSTSRFGNFSSSSTRHSAYSDSQGQSESEPPISFPLPPSMPYGSYSSSQNSRPNNHLTNSSGGGVRVWLKEHLEANSSRRSRLAESQNLVPDMELIKIGSNAAVGSDSNSSRSPLNLTHSHTEQEHGGSSYLNPRQSKEFPSNLSIHSLLDQGRMGVSQRTSLETYGRSQPTAGSSLLQRSFDAGGSRSDLSRNFDSELQNVGSSSGNFQSGYVAPQMGHRFLDENGAMNNVSNYDTNESELQILKVAYGSGSGPDSGPRSMSNGFNRETHENFQYSDYNINTARTEAMSSSFAATTNADNPNLRQQQYYVDEPIIIGNNDNDNNIPLTVHPRGHKVFGTDRFTYS